MRQVAHFSLVADRENQNRFRFLLDAVKSQIPRSTTGDHQLSQTMLDWAAHHRVSPEHSNSLLDQTDGLGCCRGVGIEQKIGESFEVGERTFRIDQRRQDLAFGLAGLLPATRAAR